ncbi:HNH endonuclease [Patescibacteria group bacterium]|nr:HNH endonuclease [Patescibacteria group bacterium]MBU2579976.1 HNH endonuclease [Patescibacteria group bacterium]
MARKNGRNGKNEPSKHHIIPESRGGGNESDNVKIFPRRFHSRWHDIFGNLTPHEAIQFIKEVFLDESKITGVMKKRRKRSWRWDELYELQLSIQRETIRNKRRKK